MAQYTAKSIAEAIKNKLMLNFSRTPEDALEAHIFKASALVIRDIMAEERAEKPEHSRQRQIHYMSMEFLIGRSLAKNAYNLGVLPQLTEALRSFGYDPSDIFEREPDAGLGNGGLGRLAACYLDSMASLGLNATGYSLCYELGIFRQKIVDGQQVELTDNWLELGDSWLMTHTEDSVEVKFGGTVEEKWDSGRLNISYRDCDTVIAVPRDMLVAGYATDNVCTLRLWEARSPCSLDMSLFSNGEYLRALERRAMAEVITKVLYPEDNHPEGKSLRLKQQYFFVSATVQSIVREHRKQYGTVKNFAEKHILHINDTHPALAIPELMRILMDEDGLSWDEAWSIVTRSFAYTNHTVLPEALERWPQELVASLMPRIWSILQEINNRWCARVGRLLPSSTAAMAVIWGGEVRMANLCVCACCAVNGVSALHSDILKKDIFPGAYSIMPEKFTNVTNGIDYRRWLCQSNPGLHELICSLIGDKYMTVPDELRKLERFSSDSGVLARMAAVKKENKLRFADLIKRTQGIVLNTDAVFDVQVKRLHEYKRQLLNVLHICRLYSELLSDPGREFLPRTFIFGAKAASGYAAAKQIIRLICSLSRQINSDPVCRDRLQVFFLENYNVSMAEPLFPASDISEQISTAGKEASGTGNMKFMMNGCVTIGTLDGANVEMHDVLGDDNMFIFGLDAAGAASLLRSGYDPGTYLRRSESLKNTFDMLSRGFSDGVSYRDIVDRLMLGGSRPDEYLLLADYESYCQTHDRIDEAYKDRARWQRMALINTARSGIFAADRSIRSYADYIWHVPHR